MLHYSTESYTYYWKKNRPVCNNIITYTTTDKTDSYMEKLRFSLRLNSLSYLHTVKFRK